MKRSKPSRYEDLRELFHRTVTARYISGFELVTCDADEGTEGARARMDHYGYDMLPVLTNGIILGYVDRMTLGQGACREWEQRLGPPDLVSDSTPILDLFPVLEHRVRVFVLQGNRVTGVVSRSDLQKAPVRMLLFTLATLLEAHLQRLVRVLYAERDWRAHLSSARVQLAERLHAERIVRSEEVELIDCLQFCDKRDLVLHAGQNVDHLGFSSRHELERFLNEAEQLRDLLAHGQDLVSGSSWPDRIRLVMELQAVLERLETTVESRAVPSSPPEELDEERQAPS